VSHGFEPCLSNKIDIDNPYLPHLTVKMAPAALSNYI
jgi:hypothetical protein